jgi:hypothetical protein
MDLYGTLEADYDGPKAENDQLREQAKVDPAQLEALRACSAQMGKLTGQMLHNLPAAAYVTDATVIE